LFFVGGVEFRVARVRQGDGTGRNVNDRLVTMVLVVERMSGSSTVGDLAKDPAARVVNRIDDILPRRRLFVIPNARFGMEGYGTFLDRCKLGNDQARVGGPLCVVLLHQRVRQVRVQISATTGQRRHDEAIGQRHTTQLDRGKHLHDDVVVVVVVSSFRRQSATFFELWVQNDLISFSLDEAERGVLRRHKELHGTAPKGQSHRVRTPLGAMGIIERYRTERGGGPVPMRTMGSLPRDHGSRSRSRDMGNKSHKCSMWNEVGSISMT
jgi:hypothetical protein